MIGLNLIVLSEIGYEPHNMRHRSTGRDIDFPCIYDWADRKHNRANGTTQTRYACASYTQHYDKERLRSGKTAAADDAAAGRRIPDLTSQFEPGGGSYVAPWHHL